MTLGQRLREARKDAKLSQAELAKRVGIKQPTLSDLENDVTKGSTAIATIAAALGVSALWLAEGRGPRRGNEPIQNITTASIGHRRIPLISSVQAGQMTEAVVPFPPGGAYEYLLTDLELSEHAFGLEVEGRSMEPKFYEGDRLIVDPALSPRPGDFVIAKNGHEEATFKKYRPRGINAAGQDVFELVPLNPDYATINSENEPVRIIGVVVEHRQVLRR
ncbi:prophage repressor CI [Pandoraea sp. NE5]|uniref:LexA family protein n=1 Tax=Pandoraea sp. NE5 TaxID=2904129 RepID=UPI0021C3F809|nr:XRE family transcriptional regulator [Pandoraea sp. NE5]BDD90893.1 prophage repressor CI [Pandoraea sp. NE5]